MLKRALVFAAVFAVPSVALAQKTAGKTGYEDKVKAQHIDIDDGDPVEGDVMGPDGFRVSSKIPPKFEKLIKLRTSFVREIVKSGEDT